MGKVFGEATGHAKQDNKYWLETFLNHLFAVTGSKNSWNLMTFLAILMSASAYNSTCLFHISRSQLKYNWYQHSPLFQCKTSKINATWIFWVFQFYGLLHQNSPLTMTNHCTSISFFCSRHYFLEKLRITPMGMYCGGLCRWSFAALVLKKRKWISPPETKNYVNSWLKIKSLKNKIKKFEQTML